jgi:hypothetical protein
MADRATVFQGVQLGPEVTPGTNVAASKKLGSLSIEPSIDAEVEMFRPMGTKFPTLSSLGKEMTKAKLSGQLTYSEIIYVLASLLKDVTPTRLIASTGLAYSWVFAPAGSAADTVKTYTVEQGDAVRAQKFNYGLIDSAKFNFSRKEAKLDGSMIGRALTDGITMTASPTSIALKPILPAHVSLYLADTQAGLTGATALARAISASWSLDSRFGPIWALNRANSSWITHVETEPKLNCTLKVEADVEGMGLLATMRTGATKWFRIEAVGETIETTNTYKLQIDTAVKVGKPSDYSDEDGIYAIEWALNGIYDGTWGKATEITVVNEIATL